MDVAATFTPVAKELIDNVFPTPVVYSRVDGAEYDTATGGFVRNSTEHAINAGILRRTRNEGGGVAEVETLVLWVHHGSGGLPYLPTTGDIVSYDGTSWAVSSVDPSYTSDALIVSKITCTAPG